MVEKFNHLNVPSHWKHYWTKYPEGYTILEALLNWVAQVDKMVDNINDWNEYLDDFVMTFDKDLRDKVVSTLSEWQESGFLDVVIDQALQTQIDDVSEQLAQIAIYLSDYPRLEGEHDDAPRINRALQHAKTVRGQVLLPKHVIIAEPIVMPSETKLVGTGKHQTIIELRPNFNGSGGIVLEHDQVYKVEISGFTIEGNKSGQTQEVSGVRFINQYSSWQYDPYHVIKDVHVENVSGHGMDIRGRGGTIISDSSVKNCGLDGFRLHNYDSYYSNLSAGLCGDNAFNIGRGPHKIVNCKGWGSNVGFLIGGQNHSMSGIAAQENITRGIVITGKSIELSANIDGVGWNFRQQVKVPNVSALEIVEGASGNKISGTVSNQIFFNKGHGDTLSYALKINGFNNIIQLSTSGVQVGALDPESTFDHNSTVNISGAFPYGHGTFGIMTVDSCTIDTPISDFPIGLTYTPVTEQAGFGGYGVVITHKAGSYPGNRLFNRQEFWETSSNNVKQRYVIQSTGEWSEFERVVTVKEYIKSIEGRTIPANSGVSITISGLTGKGANDLVDGSPLFFLPSNLVYHFYTGSPNSAGLRIVNVSNNDVELPTGDWKIEVRSS